MTRDSSYRTASRITLIPTPVPASATMLSAFGHNRARRDREARTNATNETVGAPCSACPACRPACRLRREAQPRMTIPASASSSVSEPPRLLTRAEHRTSDREAGGYVALGIVHREAKRLRPSKRSLRTLPRSRIVSRAAIREHAGQRRPPAALPDLQLGRISSRRSPSGRPKRAASAAYRSQPPEAL